MRPLALLLAMLLPLAATAGTACREVSPGPAEVAQAAATALTVREALEARDAPVALVARAGTDLSRHGLHYSHAGFALRDHRDGRWTVVHLLNECGSDRSGIYAQGLVNFFADDLVNQDARIVWLAPDLAERLATMLADDRHAVALHHPRYNLLARPDSRRTQNSTAWVLEALASARLPLQGLPERSRAQAMAHAAGHVPDTIRLPYTRRIAGGLFAANVDFTDHPVGARLAGEYPVVTVRSILRWLDASGMAVETMEWRRGRLQATPGPM